MKTHIDVLGWLHIFWGGFGLLAGASLWILAAGTRFALVDLGLVGPAGFAAVWMFLICGLIGGFGGAMMIAAGRSLHRRHTSGRLAVLVLAVPNLVLVPFGTALGVYACWVLLNDDARAEFGRPSRAAARLANG